MSTQCLVKLLQITDTHCYADDQTRLAWSLNMPPSYPNLNLELVLTHLADHYADYDALLISGDLAQEEIAQTYQRLNKRLQAFPLPVHVISGNHDTVSLMQNHLDQCFWQSTTLNYQSWHCILLETNRPHKPDGYLSQQQYQDLAAYLERLTDKQYALIVMHHHPMQINSPWMDHMGLQEAAVFWQLLAQYPQVKAVVNGHIHQEFKGQYTYSDGRSVAVYGTPATSVQLKPLTERIVFDHNRPAWRTLHLYPDGTIESAVHYL